MIFGNKKNYWFVMMKKTCKNFAGLLYIYLKEASMRNKCNSFLTAVDKRIPKKCTFPRKNPENIQYVYAENI